ncbi:MAG: tetratricopeptide repeat protein [Myxococcaceae bacterium]|nr:tetratricopeptide repeat protein [Myxococcaceae bacterium]MCI0668925.1 tetratricopeptide repeat protein [Myxococcaceae bacterium]
MRARAERVMWSVLVLGGVLAGCAHTPAQPSPDRIGEALAHAQSRYLDGHWLQSAEALEAAAAQARASQDTRLKRVELEWARVLVDLGRRDRTKGDRALVLLEGLRSGSSDSDRALLADVLLHTGRVHYWRKLIGNEGDWERPLTLFREAHAQYASHRNVRGEGESLFYVALVHQFREQWAEARTLFERSLALSRQARDLVGQGYTLRHLGYLEDREGRLDQALALHRQALEAREAAGWRVGAAFQAIAVGDVLCVRQGSCAEAEPLYSRAASLAAELGDPILTAEASLGLGRAAWARRDGGSARSHLAAARAAAETGGDAVIGATVALIRAEVLHAAGDDAEARRTLERARASLERSGQEEMRGELDQALSKLAGSTPRPQ